MIINQILDKKNIIKCSYFDAASQGLLNNSYSVKTAADISSWKIYKNLIKASISVISYDISHLDNIELDVSGTSMYTISTSIDYIHWTELPYKTDNSNLTETRKIFKYTHTADNIKYYIDTNTGEQIAENVDWHYAYVKFNTNTQQYDKLLVDYEFQHVRVEFDNIEAAADRPFYINNLDISINEDYKSSYYKKSLFSIKSSDLYKQKMFEEQQLFPDIVSNFCKMLETNDSNSSISNYQQYFLLNNNVYIDEISSHEYPHYEYVVPELALPIGQAVIGQSNMVL